MTKVYIVEKREDYYENEEVKDVFNSVLGVFKRRTDALKAVREDISGLTNVERYDKDNYCIQNNIKDGDGFFVEWSVVDRDVE